MERYKDHSEEVICSALQVLDQEVILITGSRDKTAVARRILALSSPALDEFGRIYAGHTAAIRGVTTTPLWVFTVDDNREIKKWSLRSSAPICSVKLPLDRGVISFARYIPGPDREGVVLWGAFGGQVFGVSSRVLTDTKAACVGKAVNFTTAECSVPDLNLIVTGSISGEVEAWDISPYTSGVSSRQLAQDTLPSLRRWSIGASKHADEVSSLAVVKVEGQVGVATASLDLTGKPRSGVVILLHFMSNPLPETVNLFSLPALQCVKSFRLNDAPLIMASADHVVVLGLRDCSTGIIDIDADNVSYSASFHSEVSS